MSVTVQPEPMAAILLRPPVVRVHVGGCVATGRRFRSKAHAHTSGAHVGTICFMSRRWLCDDALAIHEVCHLLAGRGHDDAWRAKVIEMGGTLDPTRSLRSYHKRGCTANCPALDLGCNCTPKVAP